MRKAAAKGTTGRAPAPPAASRPSTRRARSTGARAIAAGDRRAQVADRALDGGGGPGVARPQASLQRLVALEVGVDGEAVGVFAPAVGERLPRLPDHPPRAVQAEARGR